MSDRVKYLESQEAIMAMSFVQALTAAGLHSAAECNRFLRAKSAEENRADATRRRETAELRRLEKAAEAALWYKKA